MRYGTQMEISRELFAEDTFDIQNIINTELANNIAHNLKDDLDVVIKECFNGNMRCLTEIWAEPLKKRRRKMDKLFLYLEEIGLSYEEKEKILSIIDE
jgi:hypothetical protein